MRPHKHVTAARRAAQEVFEISIARQGSRPGRPIATVCERDEITLYGWYEDGGVWRGRRIPHAPIEVVRGVPSISNTWNWSRRIGLATLDDVIYLVYKRAPEVEEGEDARLASLIFETYTMSSATGTLQLGLREAVPMPIYPNPDPPEGLGRVFLNETPGFELWTGIDVERRKLLIVTQTLGETSTPVGGNPRLTLLMGDLDQLDQINGWESEVLGNGGYGLDVRHQDNTLTIVYRETPESVRVALPEVDVNSLNFPPDTVEIDSSSGSDQFFEPLQILQLDLATFTETRLEIPGGEHPRIQNVDPLLIVVDRPHLQVQFRVSITIQGFIPEIDLDINWTMSRTDKLAYMVGGPGLVARGVLISIDQRSTRLSLPRTVSRWVNVQDLYQMTPTNIRWASTFPRFPLEPLAFTAEQRRPFVFDFLHKAPWFALQRSRSTFTADFNEGQLTFIDLTTGVYDINHDQMGRPEARDPNTIGENAQFAPFQHVSQQSDTPVRPPRYVCDNTIGGSLVTDRNDVPHQFVSYTDLGDGGLRIIFDADLRPPDAPPPVKDPKALSPESVTGPGSEDERWIELEASDWKDAGVPAIGFADPPVQPTMTSAMNCQIESLLFAAQEFSGLVMDEDGWADTEVNDIQSDLNTQPPPFDPPSETFFSDDGNVPRAFIRITPANVLGNADTILEAGIEDETVSSVAWVMTLLTGGDAQFVATGSGSPVTLTPLTGNWILRADITRNNGTVRTLETPVTVGDSLFEQISSVHRQLADRDLDPPLSNFGDYQIGTSTFGLLHYNLHFRVPTGEDEPNRIAIEQLGATDAQWRFDPNALEQGRLNYRLRIRFECDDLRLSGMLDTLAKVESIRASFFYGRAFTPAILMNDTRSVDPLTGAERSSDGLELSYDGAELPRLSSGLTARPVQDSQITVEKVKAEVSMLSQAVAASVVILLVGLGATAASLMLLLLLALLGVAIAAAALPFAGLAAALAVVAAAAAVFLFISTVVPPLVETAIEENVKAGLMSNDTRDSLDESRFLQFAGEGLAEAIGRQVIRKARESNTDIDPPGDPNATRSIERDRYRPHLFQMIHVTEGRCRVLIRG